jgi:VWFA-related protein
MNRAFRLLGLAAVLTAAGMVSGSAQEAPSTFTEVVDVNIVNVEVFVTDKKGNPITGLAPEDFRLFVDGQETPISNFYSEVGGTPARVVAPAPRPSRPSATPALQPADTPAEQVLHLMVLVDNANLKPSHRRRVFRSLREFLASDAATGARIAVASYGPTLVLHSDFLSDHATIGKILDDLEKTAEQQPNNELERRAILSAMTSGFGSRGPIEGTQQEVLVRLRAYAQEEHQRGLVALANLERFVNTLGGVPGRRALFYVADGIPLRPGAEFFEGFILNFTRDRGGRAVDTEADFRRDVGDFDLTRQFQSLANRANANRVTVYTLDAAGDHADDIRGAATEGRVDTSAISAFQNNFREPQELVAQATGGRRLEATAELAEDLAAVATDFSTYYSLGFAAERTDSDRPRQVRVEVQGKDAVVRHRSSFSWKSREQLNAEHTLAALLYGAESNPLDVTVDPGSPDLRNDGSAVLPLAVRIPLSRVALIPRGNTHVGQLSVFVSTRDKNGEPRPVQKLPFHLQIPADKLEEALGQRAEYKLPLVVRPGDQQVALGVGDDISQVVSTLRLDLTRLVSLGAPKGN